MLFENRDEDTVATLTIGESLLAVTFQCVNVTVPMGTWRRQARVVIVVTARTDLQAIAALAAWARSGTACTFKVHDQTMRMVPKRWVAEAIPGRAAHGFTVDLEEVVDDGVPSITATCSSCGCRGWCPSKVRGEVDHDAVPCAKCGCRWCGPAVAGLNPPGTYRCLGCDDCVPHGTPHACGGEEAIRLREEAPLVELVKAVPDGLDPIGWRAAVLGLRERHVLNGRFSATEATVTDAKNLTVMLQRFAADIARGVPVEEAQTATNSRCLAMTTAYARVIAPRGPRPEPHRRRAPGLPLDAD